MAAADGEWVAAVVDVPGLVTDRDLALVSWVGRFPFLTVDLVHRWFQEIQQSGKSLSIVYARLDVLAQAGLIESAAVLANVGRAVWLTREGLRAAGVSGHSRPPRVSTFTHDLWVAQLATSIAINKPRHQLVTEREMRAEDTANQHEAGALSKARSYASGRIGGTAATRLFPDLLSIAPSNSRVVHEIERTGKDHRRLVQIMLAHLANTENSQIRYYSPNDIFRRLETAATVAREIALDRGCKCSLSCVKWEEVQL